jgi:ElaB/YqjD/DUF883 family membrane-anchored ribosome-binding protein
MKSFKQLNEDISNIINPQPLDEAKRKSVSKADVSKANKMLASVRTTIDNMRYMLEPMREEIVQKSKQSIDTGNRGMTVGRTTEEAERAWKNVNSAISEMNICLNSWGAIILIQADMIREKSKR